METDVLEGLVARGATLAEIAGEAGVDRSTVRRWLRRAGLQTHHMTTRQANERARSGGLHELRRPCPTHGPALHRLDARGTYRCTRCNADRVADRRRAVKETLVAEAGGRCVICGYHRCKRALSFHHLDPATKEFSLARRGHTRSIDRARAEAAKCALLCSNCHMEVESGIAKIPLTSGPQRSGVAQWQSGTLLR